MKEFFKYSIPGVILAALIFGLAHYLTNNDPLGDLKQRKLAFFPMLQPLNEAYKPLSYYDLNEEVQIVTFFASWCPPCKVEHPHLMRMEKETSVSLHGIVFKDEREKAVAYLNENGNPYKTVSIDSAPVNNAFKIRGLPQSFVIDGNQNIIYQHSGAVLEKDLEETFYPLIKRLRQKATNPQ